jgi:alanine dehydrogenase
MAKPVSPFTASQLIPQEEMLEVEKTKGDLFIGIPKEIYFQEKRICLTPDAVSALCAQGHKILIENGAGEGASFSDRLYSEAGAILTQDTKKAFSCPIVLKVEPPTIEEMDMMIPKAVLISALQLKTRKKKFFEALAKKKITALAFEFLQDDKGSYPAVSALSEIAGTASILIAAELMVDAEEGNGLMF